MTYGISSIIPYYQRTNKFIKANKDNVEYKDFIKNEKSNQILYVILGSILCLIQLGISWVIIKGSQMKP